MTLDKFGRHISKRTKVNDVKDLVNEVTKNISLKILDYKKKNLDIDLNINKIGSDIKLVEEFVKNENKLLKENVEKINQILRTITKEVIFFKAKESINELRKDIEKLNTTKTKIIDSVLNGQQISALSISDRHFVGNIHSLINSLIQKLTKEVDKIDEGMGDVDTLLNPALRNYLNTKIKDTFDFIRKTIVKIEAYLKLMNKVILIQNLEELNDTYKSSYWDSYIFKSVA